jgi:translin
MNNLEAISERIREDFEARNAARDQALQRSRTLTRHCANAIKATHREEWKVADERLETARQAAAELIEGVRAYPDLYHTGYTQDALKEYVEAFVTYAIVRDQPLPEPEGLGVEFNTYLNGLAEATTEMRRRVLDIMRHDYDFAETERLLEVMDAVYDTLMTFDFPDAITGGLRRRTDTVRGVLERTRGDLTNSFRRQQLADAISHLEARLDLDGADQAG